MCAQYSRTSYADDTFHVFFPFNLRFYFSIHSHAHTKRWSFFPFALWFVICNFRSREEKKCSWKPDQITLSFLNCVVAIVVSFALYLTERFDCLLFGCICLWLLCTIDFFFFYYYKLNFPRKPYFSLLRILITHIASFDTIFILLSMSSNSCSNVQMSMLMRIKTIQTSQIFNWMRGALSTSTEDNAFSLP